MKIKLLISAEPCLSLAVDAATGEPIDGVIDCQFSGGNNNFAPLVHLTLANVEIVREPVQVQVVERESPFMGNGA